MSEFEPKLVNIFISKQLLQKKSFNFSNIEDWIEKMKKIIETNDYDAMREEIRERMFAINRLGTRLFYMNISKTQFVTTVLNGPYFYAFFLIEGFDNDAAIEILKSFIDEKIITESKITVGSLKTEIYLFKISLAGVKISKGNQAFLISEFSDENNKVNMAIRESFKKDGIHVIVMNIDHKLGNIDIAIKKHMSESNHIICNLTYKTHWNANVFYELGMANAWNKPTIMFLRADQFPGAEQANNLPFDINSHACLKLNDGDKGLEELISELKQIIL